MKLLIVNADDFGYSSGINNGIMDAYHNGILTSATIMANMPGFNQAIEMAKANPGLGVGVHLVLTCASPLLKNKKSISTETGEFKNISFYEGDYRIDPDEVYQEWHAQIQKVIDAGIQPDHIDSHHFVNMFPQIHEAYERLAREYNLPVRGNYEVPSDITTTARFDDAVDHFALTKPVWKSMAIRDLIQDVQTYGSVEAMSHPGYVDAELNDRSSFTTGRVYTCRELQRPELASQLKDAGITLGTFGDLNKQ